MFTSRLHTKREVLTNLRLPMDVHPVSTIGNDEAMLREWFNHRLAPLFDRHQELATESTRRKAGALREAVTAALRLKLGNGRVGTPLATPLEEVERRLRTAAGEIEETRQFCLDATDDIRSLHEIAHERSVNAVLESWNGSEPGSSLTSDVIGRAVGRLAAEATTQISGRLTVLADHLSAALVLAAEVLRDTSDSSDGALQDCVREMPRFEIALPEIRIARPWFLPVRGVTRTWLARRLERDVATVLQTGFANYGRALEAWVRRVLGGLQERFDARADAYRAQLARLMERKSLSQAQRTQIEGHLAELEGILAASER